MFEVLIQRNIEAAGDFAGNRQEAIYRVKKRQERVKDGVVPFNRAGVSSEPSAGMPRRPAQTGSIRFISTVKPY